MPYRGLIFACPKSNLKSFLRAKQAQTGKHNCNRKYLSKPVRQQALLEPLEGAHLALLKLVKYGAQRHSLLDHRRANVLHERQLDPPTLRNCLSF